MDTYRYPRRVSIEAFLRWANEGGQVWSDQTYRRSVLHPSVRDLIVRLEMPGRFEEMRLEAAGQTHGRGRGLRYGGPPRDELLNGILDNLRAHGYVFPLGPIPADRSRPLYGLTPLTGRQLHIIRMYSWGMLTADIAGELGMETSNVRERMARARTETGTRTTGQLLCCCYRNNWLPGHLEYRTLLSTGILGRGYTITDMARTRTENLG